MRTFSILIQSLAFAIMPFCSSSANEEVEKTPPKTHHFEISPEISQFKGGSKFLGLGGKYRYEFDQSYVELDLGYAHSSCIKRNKYRIIGTYGYNIPLTDSNSLILTPYLGFGYRRDIFGQKSGLKDFKLSMPTLPVGLTLSYKIKDKTTLKFNTEYEFYFKDHLNVHQGNKFNRRMPGSIRANDHIHALKFQPSLEIGFNAFSIEAKPYLRYTSLGRPGFKGSREIGFALGFKY